MIIKGQIVLPEGVMKDAYLSVEDGRIASISLTSPGGPVRDFGSSLIMPGFIDIHLHGLGRYQPLDVVGMEGMAGLEVSYGTTAFLPTLADATREDYISWESQVEKAMAADAGARILGAHMEGPFINAEGKGGMDADYLRLPDKAEYMEYLQSPALKLMTLSPELPAAGELIRALTARGVIASLGHSVAGRETLDMAVAAGARYVCHLFDAMPEFPSVNRGTYAINLPYLCMLHDELMLELIADGIHVLFDHVRLVKKACGIERITVITDSLPGTGQADGVYSLNDGRKFVLKGGDVARLEDDPTLIVGSTLTMNRAVGNLVEQCGFSIDEASLAVSGNPARGLGLGDTLGSIAPGKTADIAVLDDRYDCLLTLVGGREVYGI